MRRFKFKSADRSQTLHVLTTNPSFHRIQWDVRRNNKLQTVVVIRKYRTSQMPDSTLTSQYKMD